jgi:hypothetical protein
MFQQHPEYDAMLARQRYDDILTEMDAVHLAAQLRPHPSLFRQAANGIGQFLIWAGTLLTRYGHPDLRERTFMEV